MKRLIPLLLLWIVLISNIVPSKNGAVYNDPKAGVFFREWLLCGPFPNPLPKGINGYRFDSTSLGHYRDYLMQYGGEGKIRPFEGMEVKHPDGHQVKWTLIRNPFGLIPLNEMMKPSEETVCYAACTVNSSVEKRMVLSITSNDGVRIWQNGTRILEHNTMGSEEPDRDLVPIKLLKGENYFCVKISQGHGKWNFQFRLLDNDQTTSRIEESDYLYLRPEITETADDYKIFVGQRYKVELLRTPIPAEIKIMDIDENHVVASYHTALGETLTIKKSSLDLIPGLHPVSCSIILPDGKQAALRNYIFKGKAPNIVDTYAQFKRISLPDSTTFLGKQILKNAKCMNFQLADDARAGNLEPMDSWTQNDVTVRFAKWVESLKNAPSPYHHVYPAIQKIELQKGGEFILKNTLSYTDLTGGVLKADLNRIAESLKITKQGISIVKAVHGDVVLGLVKDFPEVGAVNFPNGESYRILVDKNQIKVIGATIKGLHFGLVTLKQLFEMNKPLPSVDLLDFPAAAHRATFQYLPLPMTEKSKARILEYVDLKYNEIVVRSSDYRKLSDPEIKKGFQAYFEYIKSFQIEPIPLLWITGDPAWEEGFAMENEPLTFKGDRAEMNVERMLDMKSSRPKFLSKADNGTVYIPGKDYKVVSLAPPILERIPSGRIPKDATIYFSGDLVDSKAHRFSKTCPSEELAYEEFDRLVGQIIKVLNPQKIHVNHDELGLVNSDSRCKKRNLKEHQLLAYQVNRMSDIIKKHNPTVDMIMWADCINPYHNAGLKFLEKTADLLNKDIVLTQWFYSAENYQQRDLIETGTTYLLDRGFRVYCSPWDHLVNHQDWEKTLLKNASNPNFMGLMHTEWYNDDRSFGLAETGEVNWSGKTWLTQ